MKLPLLLSLLTALLFALAAAAQAPAPDLGPTRPLEGEGDLAAGMVAGIDRFLTRETEAGIGRRARHWQRDFSSPGAYARSVEPNRQRLRRILGVVDPRVPFREPEPVLALSGGAEVVAAPAYRVLAVRWPVLPGVEGEGLLLEPRRPPVASVVALPDCDWTPERLVGLAPGVPPEAQFARRLAESGCRVLVPTLVDRQDRFSGDPAIRMTNQPHREWVYRGAFEMGRHVIGYEVQKVLAAVDWLKSEAVPKAPVGVAGYGEGGLLAFYSAAVDPRIDAALVSGYFGPREALWREPIYRNVWGLLEEFGDAEIASLVAPRPLMIEHCRFPQVAGPPPAREGRSGAAPGSIETPALPAVAAEVERAARLLAGLKPEWQPLLSGDGSGSPGNPAALSAFLRALQPDAVLAPSGPAAPPELRDSRAGFDPDVRQKRQVEQLVEYTQRLMREAPARRAEFWRRADASSVERWTETARPYRDYFWDEVIGRFPPPDPPKGGERLTPRVRLLYDEPKYRGYEVVLDVWPDVFASGILLVPKEIPAGERRPVVVCQHGLEGRPADAADPKVDNHYYHRFAGRLAEEGFVTFSPQNPYIGGDRFRVLQRKANPLKKSLFSVIVRQHQRILEWLGGLSFVDPQRIAFYGLSYGGKTAMRVPALLEGYCLSICSGDYNEWIWKNVSAHDPHSYLFTGEYEMFEFDLGNTFNYAEMSQLIFPRPFMVERGHEDGVAPDEWVAYEYAKTRRHYDRFGLGDRTEIEFFNGPHTIHGVGTFAFLRRHLQFPVRLQ
ncbi:MAG TPA: dienelactone hydrolase family protein [Armatimonadota bacterium]|nr:dienelactone hydrolase family protein [Armatimonadota bacterium]